MFLKTPSSLQVPFETCRSVPDVSCHTVLRDVPDVECVPEPYIECNDIAVDIPFLEPAEECEEIVFDDCVEVRFYNDDAQHIKHILWLDSREDPSGAVQQEEGRRGELLPGEREGLQEGGREEAAEGREEARQPGGERGAEGLGGALD